MEEPIKCNECLFFWSAHYGGGMYEPPDYDEGCDLEELLGDAFDCEVMDTYEGECANPEATVRFLPRPTDLVDVCSRDDVDAMYGYEDEEGNSCKKCKKAARCDVFSAIEQAMRNAIGTQLKVIRDRKKAEEAARDRERQKAREAEMQADYNRRYAGWAPGVVITNHWQFYTLESMPVYHNFGSHGGNYARIKDRDGQVREIAIDGFYVIDASVMQMQSPYFCPLCHQYFDLALPRPHQDWRICPTCQGKFTIEDHNHENVSISGSDIGRPQWNCYHYYMCKKCGNITAYDSSD